MRGLGGAASPAISRRRGTRGGGSGGGGGILSLKALVVLGMICVSIFALGLILGARAVGDPAASPSSATAAAGEGGEPLGRVDAAAKEIHRLVAESARAEAARLKAAAAKIGKGLRGRKGGGGEEDAAAGGPDGAVGDGDGGLDGIGRGGVPRPGDPNYNPHRPIDDDDHGAGADLEDGGADGGKAADFEAVAQAAEEALAEAEALEGGARGADGGAEGAEGDAEKEEEEENDDKGGKDDDDEAAGDDAAAGAGDAAKGPPEAKAALRRAAKDSDRASFEDMFPPDNAGKGPFPDPYLGEPVPDGHDFSSYAPLGGDRFKEWKDGSVPYAITSDLMRKSDELARNRRKFVKKAMRHAWRGYKKYAFGMDEVLPLSRRGHSNWGGMGTTLVDSLDTLWLMGMKEEFTEGRDWVRDRLDHTKVNKPISVFETTIRSLGGLLSAYDLSGDRAFLDKAEDLGQRLFKAFATPSGIPFGSVNINTGRAQNFGWAGNNAILSEFATLQVEYRYLARATGKKEYAERTEKIYRLLKEIEPANGLYPLFVRNNKPKPEFATQKLSFGAMGDSLYEYMLKIWIQGGKTEPMYREMYDKSIQGMHDELLHRSKPNGLTYIADKNFGKVDHKMDHLVCFMGGLLALGAYTDPRGMDSERAKRDLGTARELAYTCYQMYARQRTGISPEFAAFAKKDTDFSVGRNGQFYILRPETVESFFVLNKLTGDPVYREWGWEIFRSIEKYCRTEVAYGSLKDVNDPNLPPEDRMESFFLAETMKYLYLLFDPDTEVDIVNKHVLNTEAHPLRIFPEFDKSSLAPKR